MEDNTTNVGALIPISENNGKQAVSARDLYNFLGCTERFQSWFERQLQYGFVEDVDYTSVKSFTVVGNGAEKPIDDYAMTIDMAKEVSMIQRSEKSKEARTYFIACEKKLKSLSSPSYMIEDPIQRAEKWIEEQKQLKQLVAQNERQAEKIEQDKPKVLFADAVSTSQRSCLIAELAKILKQNGVNIGQNRLFVWLRRHGYLCTKGQYYNQPTQRALELGLFEIKKTTINKPDGSILVSSTPKVTGKGQIYFVNKFLGGGTSDG